MKTYGIKQEYAPGLHIASHVTVSEEMEADSPAMVARLKADQLKEMQKFVEQARYDLEKRRSRKDIEDKIRQLQRKFPNFELDMEMSVRLRGYNVIEAARISMMHQALQWALGEIDDYELMQSLGVSI